MQRHDGYRHFIILFVGSLYTALGASRFWTYSLDTSNSFITFAMMSSSDLPSKITYEQVAEGIEKLNTRASDRKQRHRQLSAELKGMEKGEAYLTRLKPYWQKFKYQLDYIPFKP